MGSWIGIPFLVTELVFLDDFLLTYTSLICHRDKI